jgi:hypothetical protein
MDTFFSYTPALNDGIYIHSGSSMIQFYCGCTSQLTATFPIKKDSDMARTLEDFISLHGAPSVLFSDNAKAQIGHAVHCPSHVCHC